MKLKTALTIAGSDCSGGAGIQADLKTMTMQGVYAMSVITALTAQNTTGVRSIYPVTAAFLADQLDMIFTDIVPDAVKIGMVSSAQLADVIAGKLRQYSAKHVVLDPVMVATSGAPLLARDAVNTLREALFPLSDIVTPNIPEAEILTGSRITGNADMERAARQIAAQYGTAVLLKGGHITGSASDVLCDGEHIRWFHGKYVRTANTHGTGCTLSSALAAALAKGYPMEEAVTAAKEYLSGALSAGLELGSGPGPVHHAFSLHTGEVMIHG